MNAGPRRKTCTRSLPAHDPSRPRLRTHLRRFEQKGHLTHDAEGRAYDYRGGEPRRSSRSLPFVKSSIDSVAARWEELTSGRAKLLTGAELTP